MMQLIQTLRSGGSVFAHRVARFEGDSQSTHEEYGNDANLLGRLHLELKNHVHGKHQYTDVDEDIGNLKAEDQFGDVETT